MKERQRWSSEEDALLRSYGSLTEEEQRLVIQLQVKHGNKWKKIAAKIPGRTAKRLGKWWEVFKEKQQRERKENKRGYPVEEGKYDQILENFAEKLVKERSTSALLMATSNNGFVQTEPPAVDYAFPVAFPLK
ncbi:hypothetical protein MLD38_032634 [Melastoma candidum]|uniref:Uncharacterized protein n=1 Tax=Melastoma candidum TaxID=119954 RepID=A0ACB9M490_9MYRT|nr:hypothetical protein MLD38_032634 [Melastoma candidum]